MVELYVKTTAVNAVDCFVINLEHSQWCKCLFCSMLNEIVSYIQIKIICNCIIGFKFFRKHCRGRIRVSVYLLW